MLIGNGDLRGCTNDSAASTSGSMWVITLEIGRGSEKVLPILLVVWFQFGADDRECDERPFLVHFGLHLFEDLERGRVRVATTQDFEIFKNTEWMQKSVAIGVGHNF